MGIIGLEAPGNQSDPFLSYNFSICLWENPETLISMNLGLLNVSRTPNPTQFIFGDTKIPKETRETPSGIFKTYYFCQSSVELNIPHVMFVFPRKRWAPKKDEDPSNKSWKSRIWDQQLSNTHMKSKFGNMGSLSL